MIIFHWSNGHFSKFSKGVPLPNFRPKTHWIHFSNFSKFTQGVVPLSNFRPKTRNSRKTQHGGAFQHFWSFKIKTPKFIKNKLSRSKGIYYSQLIVWVTLSVCPQNSHTLSFWVIHCFKTFFAELISNVVCSTLKFIMNIEKIMWLFYIEW